VLIECEVILNKKLGRRWKEEFVACFKSLLISVPGGNERMSKDSQDGLSTAQNRTRLFYKADVPVNKMQPFSFSHW
jgi:hypothetical protein